MFPFAKGEADIGIINNPLCLSEDELYVYGTYDSDVARTLSIRVDRCSGHDYCLDETAAKDALKGNYILLAMNRIRFKSTELGEEAIVKDSKIQTFPVMTIV